MDGSNGSNGKSVALLERIAERLETMDSRLESMDSRLESMESRLDEQTAETRALRQDMNRGFAQVNGRIDNVIAFMGRHHGDHEERIRVLEERVLGKAKG